MSLGLLNATLTNVKAPPVADAMGTRSFGAGTTVNVRVFADAPTSGQKLATDARVSTADLVMYLSKPQSFSVVPGGRVTLAVDGSASAEYEVQHVIDRQLPSSMVSHYECFLKAVGS